MAKDDLYTQVQIATAPDCVEGGYVHRDVRWIPKRFARVGKRIKFQKDSPIVFMVEEVYGTMRAETVDIVRSEHQRFEAVLDRKKRR